MRVLASIVVLMVLLGAATHSVLPLIGAGAVALVLLERGRGRWRV